MAPFGHVTMNQMFLYAYCLPPAFRFKYSFRIFKIFSASTTSQLWLCCNSSFLSSFLLPQMLHQHLNISFLYHALIRWDSGPLPASSALYASLNNILEMGTKEILESSILDFFYLEKKKNLE